MRKYIVYDCETGGTDEQKHSLLTICLRVTDATLQAIEVLDLKVKPADGVYKVTRKALEINGINLIEHDKEAITYKEAKSKILNFLTRHSVQGTQTLTPIGYNVDFDDRFIRTYLMSKDEWEMHVSYRKLDVSTAFELLKFFNVIPGSAKAGLSNVAKLFGHSSEGAHIAEVDVNMTVNVLKSMKQLARGNK